MSVSTELWGSLNGYGQVLLMKMCAGLDESEVRRAFGASPSHIADITGQTSYQAVRLKGAAMNAATDPTVQITGMLCAGAAWALDAVDTKDQDELGMGLLLTRKANLAGDMAIVMEWAKHTPGRDPDNVMNVYGAATIAPLTYVGLGAALAVPTQLGEMVGMMGGGVTDESKAIATSLLAQGAEGLVAGLITGL